MSDPVVKSVALQEVPELRRKTEGTAKLLQEHLTHHLDILRPLLAPERILGKYTGAKLDTAGAERAYSELQQKYKEFSAKPFDLPQELDAQWLTLVGNRLDVYAWEYSHEAKTDRESKTITMTSPLRWIVSFTSNYTFAQARKVLAGQEQRRPDYLRQFVVNALVAQLVIVKNPGITELFRELHYDLKVMINPDTLQLPLVTITSSLPSFRPADDLILAAAAFSGIPAFIELIDMEAARNLQDPFKARIEEMLK